MDETEFQIRKIEALLKVYCELNRMKACEPGERSHMLATSLEWVQRRLREALR